jgi:peptide subunit release factor 1 (eRF1)
MKAELTLQQNPLSNLMNKLAEIEPIGVPFVSVYLNAQAGEHGRDSYATFLKNEMTAAAADFTDTTEQSESFKKDQERIEAFLGDIRPQANGLAIFSCGAVDFFETAQFQAPIPNNRFFVYDRPHIFPLARLIGQNPRFIVVQADTNFARIYVFGGEAATDVTSDTDTVVEEIQNVKTQRQQQGGWSQQRFQRRVENFHDQHAKEVIETLDKLVRDEGIDMVIFAGDEARIIRSLRDNLTKPLEGKIIAEINNNQYANESELYEAGLDEVRRYDREQDREAAARLVGAKESSDLGVYGVANTLAALSNGQVEEMLILADPRRIRYDEDKVDEILEEYAPGDDNSANDALPDTGEKRQILDELIARALNSSARIRFIEENSLLSAIGGVGAILRYKIEGQEQIMQP